MKVKTSDTEYILDITLDSVHMYARIAALNFKLVKMITHLVYLLKKFYPGINSNVLFQIISI